jgi:isopenicillin N synthase-like dioxygenase
MAEIDVPIISLAGFFSDDAAARARVVAEVKDACLKCGFFMVQDHHADKAVIERAWKVRICTYCASARPVCR